MTMRFKRSISPAGGVVRCVSRFGRREDGSATVFTLFLISVLLMVTGYAIDAARFESSRARLQGTLDRAVLAAASLSQSMPCEDVVEDYFAKADMADKIDEIKCDVSKTGRTANASASFEMNTMFMEGVDTLVAPASGAATESIIDIEIVLALDVTGSMAGSKIANLRSAAQAFTTTVLDADTEGRVSIAVVPYNMNVHLGPWLMENMPGVALTAGNTMDCIDLPEAAWTMLGVDPDLPMEQQPIITGDYGPYNGKTWPWQDFIPPYSIAHLMNSSKMNCWRNSSSPGFEYLQVTLPSQDEATLNAKLGSLKPDGNTSIFLGMKWGLTMIDPEMRPVFAEAIKEGLMAPALAGRPYDYDREDTMKVIVLMTDGDHVGSSYVVPAYGSGLSPVYLGEDGNYAIHHPTWAGPNKFFVPHLAPGDKVGDTVTGWRPVAAWSGSGVVTQLDWGQVWATLPFHWVVRQLYTRPLSNNASDAVQNKLAFDQLVAMFPFTDVADMDSKLIATCTDAKAADVLVFTIAFQAPPKAKTLLQTCATSPAHYYAPVASEIGDAFDSIANTINVLRLTQ